MKYYILSLEHTRGGVACWWAPDSCGYTENLEQAGVYDLEEARRICATRSRRPNELPPEVAIPVGDELVTRTTVDLYAQRMKYEAFVTHYEKALETASEPPAFEPCRVVSGCVRRDGHPSFHCTSDQIAKKEDGL